VCGRVVVIWGWMLSPWGRVKDVDSFVEETVPEPAGPGAEISVAPPRGEEGKCKY